MKLLPLNRAMGNCWSSRGRLINLAGATAALLLIVPSSVIHSQTRSQSFEGTWITDKQTVVIARKGNGLQAKSLYRTVSRSMFGRQVKSPSWDVWGTVHRVGNTLTYQSRRALPGISAGSDVKTTQLTLSADGQSLVAISYHQISAFGHTGAQDHLIRVRMQRKSSMSVGDLPLR
jgi:hypothetical protein